MRKVLCCAGAIAGAVVLVGASAASADQYVVVYQAGASTAAAHQAIRDAGGTIVSENTDVGVATVQSSNPAFASRADAKSAVYGVSSNRAIGHAPRESGKPSWRDVESESGSFHGNGPRPRPVSGDPLGGLQWDMQLIGATPTGSYAHDQGSHARPRRDHRHGRRRQRTPTSRRTSTAA